jgi:hypothetical protein
LETDKGHVCHVKAFVSDGELVAWVCLAFVAEDDGLSAFEYR